MEETKRKTGKKKIIIPKMRRTLRTVVGPITLRSTPSSSLGVRVNAYGLLASRGLASGPATAKLKPDQPNPAWNDYATLLNNFMDKLVHKQRLGYKWWVRPAPVPEESSHLWFDEEKVTIKASAVPPTH
jgi:hypothetical protein